jgi:hypothetical protein
VEANEEVAQTRRQHRIRGTFDGERPTVPPQLKEALSVEFANEHELHMLAPASLQSVLGWLGTIPWRSIRIEPVGLRDLYDRIHPPHSSAKPPDH